MPLFRLLYPKKFTELSSLRFTNVINKTLIDKNDAFQETIRKLLIEKRAFEYFKFVLAENHQKFIKATFTKRGRFALVISTPTGKISNFEVYLEDDKWNGQNMPVPACRVAYHLEVNEIISFLNIESNLIGKGAGSIAIETLFKIAKEFKIREIHGDLPKIYLQNHKNRLIGFYEKHGFEVKLFDKNPNVGGEVYKNLDLSKLTDLT